MARRRLPPRNALRAFETAARLGSFTAAATELRVTASAISQQVRTLEKYLGARLFKRLPNGLMLTSQGRAYLPALTAGFDALSEATRRLRPNPVGGLLTVTTLPAFATGWLLPRLADFRTQYPGIDLLLKTGRELVGAAVAGLGVALGRAPHIEGHLARGQLVRLTQESWRADWSYRIVAPAANFSRPNVRAFVDWLIAQAQARGIPDQLRGV